MELHLVIGPGWLGRTDRHTGGGWCSLQRSLNPFYVFIAACIGNLTADTLWYYAGYLGKMEWLLRFGKRFGVHEESLERLEKIMCEHAPPILFFSKLTVSPMIPALVATGLVRYPWRRWSPYVFAGEMIWTGSLVLIGYFGAKAIQKVTLGLEHAILASSVLFILFILWFGRRLMKREISKNEKTSEEASDK